MYRGLIRGSSFPIFTDKKHHYLICLHFCDLFKCSSLYLQKCNSSVFSKDRCPPNPDPFLPCADSKHFFPEKCSYSAIPQWFWTPVIFQWNEWNNTPYWAAYKIRHQTHHHHLQLGRVADMLQNMTRHISPRSSTRLSQQDIWLCSLHTAGV